MPTIKDLFGQGATGAPAASPTAEAGVGSYGPPKPKALTDMLAGDTLTQALQKLGDNSDPTAFMAQLQKDPSGLYIANVGGQQVFFQLTGQEATPDTLMAITSKEAQAMLSKKQQPALLGGAPSMSGA